MCVCVYINFSKKFYTQGLNHWYLLTINPTNTKNSVFVINNKLLRNKLFYRLENGTNHENLIFWKTLKITFFIIFPYISCFYLHESFSITLIITDIE